MTWEPTIEAPMNGSRNYNGPKMRTTCTWIERPYEALLFPRIGFGPFLHILGGGRRRPPFRGGFLKGNGGVQTFPRAGRRLALECKRKRELDCKTHLSSRDESWP
ncbi:hypothetical protein AMTRI_Chr10g7670 [Amborella trichopoda]